MEDCCILTTDTARCQHLRSAGRHQLVAPRHRRSIFGRRAFSVAGPVAWNLPVYLRDPTRSVDIFRRDLKTSFLALLAYFSALGAYRCYALYKSTIDSDIDLCRPEE